MISIHDKVAMESLRSELAIQPHQIRRSRVRFHKQALGAEAALAEFPAGLRKTLAERIDFHCLNLNSVHDSALDGATKLIFSSHDGLLLETVILRVDSGRTTLCVSSQVGCQAACRFCATGSMGLKRDLNRDEILDQIVQAAEILKGENRRIRNIVFMGMGEPLHNEEGVLAALRCLGDAELFDHSLARILVSTVGVPGGMVRLVEEFPKIGLALSLHAAKQEGREALIPWARKHDLDEIRAALFRCQEIQDRSIMIEYLMLAGINDQAADAQALLDYLEGLDVHINLIPFNQVDRSDALQPSSAATQDAFGAILRDAGKTVTIRYSLGADIAAACGQLVKKQSLDQLESS